MSTKTILFTLITLNSFYSFSQPGLVRCTVQNNPDKTLSFNSSSQAYADYTLRITFTALEGYTSRSLFNSNTALVTVSPGNMEAMKLIPNNSSMTPRMQYKYQYYVGHSFSKLPDTTFQYLIPASAGNTVRVSSVSSVSSAGTTASQLLGREWRGTSFNYKLNDTICAARAGIITDCTDTVKVGEKTEVIYNRNRNRIQIEQRDGTIAAYGLTAPIKLLVKAGDEVFPGQPLAIFNVESPRYFAFFSVSYLDEKKLLTENLPDNTVYYDYIPTYFYTTEKGQSTVLERTKKYTVQYSREIISKEMTKKEKKKFGF